MSRWLQDGNAMLNVSPGRGSAGHNRGWLHLELPRLSGLVTQETLRPPTVKLSSSVSNHHCHGKSTVTRDLKNPPQTVARFSDVDYCIQVRRARGRLLLSRTLGSSTLRLRIACSCK
eukprot:1566719-Rhodomonas_salina.2